LLTNSIPYPQPACNNNEFGSTKQSSTAKELEQLVLVDEKVEERDEPAEAEADGDNDKLESEPYSNSGSTS
jgi:hypothetical protein